MSEEALFSPHWYRVAGLQPRLRPHVTVHRHTYRGERWFILQDHASGNHHRVNQSAYQLVGLLNGERPVQIAWELCNRKLADEAPTQDQIIDLLSRLHQANLIEMDVTADFDALLQRQRKADSRRKTQQMLNPLVVRLPLFDPDRLLGRITPWFDALFSPLGLALWLVLLISGLLLAAMHWQELLSQPLASFSEPRQLLLMLLVYPLIKLVHELAHGIAIKHWGGEVHQIGITLLVIMPVPFIDGNGANTFPNKWQRVAVSAAGVATELIIAVVALMFWLGLEPGLLRDIAFSTMLIAGVSTLFFNGNPLMRFDAYYVLADILEIPDLWRRSRRYYTAFFKKQLAHVDETQAIAHDNREANWLTVYGALSWTYWVLVLSGLVLLATELSHIAGVLLAAWGITTVLLIPLFKGLRFLYRHTSSTLRRLRVLLMPTALALTLAPALFLAPVSQHSYAQGVVWTPKTTRVLAERDCLVSEQLADEGGLVSAGQVLLRCDSSELDAQIATLSANIRELRALVDGYRLQDRVNRYVASDRLSSKFEELRKLQQDKRALTVKAPYDGHFHTLPGNPLVGHYFRQGSDIAHVLRADERTILAVLGQHQIGLFEPGQAAPAEIRLHEAPGRLITASALHIKPGAVHELPSPALALPNGGDIPVIGNNAQTLTTHEPVYLVEATIPAEGANTRVGGRATLRFEHTPAPLGEQWLRQLRQLFLSRLAF